MSRESKIAFVKELVRFGLIGGIGLLVDIVVFNALVATVLSSSVHGGPLIAKFISTALAIAFNWVGNRFWTYRHRRRGNLLREGIEFILVSAAGMMIALGCLWFANYVLGDTSVLADNIATNVVGLGLGTAFRFALYRWWVFGQAKSTAASQLASTASSTRVPKERV
jgi:putative flippase GtrA